MTSALKKAAPRAVADVSQGMIVATVDLAVPPERVFQALTTSEITRWWGSDEVYRVTGYTADLRPGGQWRSTGRGHDGHEFSVSGEFLEIAPPTRLVQTWKADWDGGNTTTITYRLKAIEGGTRLTLRHEGFADRAQSCEGHGEGWTRVLGWLGGYLSPQPGRFFLCRLLGPRASFMLDMSPAEREVMKLHGLYWRALALEGTALLFGPVADPKGGWGVGVLEVRDEAHLEELQRGDPAIKAGIGLRYEALPMPRVILGG